MDDYVKDAARFCGKIVLVFTLAVCAFMPALKWYNVWSERMVGKSELARAESNRQIRTLEAKAQLESSKHLADAEVVRARGVAEANQIIGRSLQENEAYLRYLWIQGLQTNQMQVVYVPTEANLPILEAGKR